MVLARLFVIFVYLVGLLIFKKLIYYFIVTPNGSQFSSFWNNNETVQDVYDYIIVGCGSAGAILANRLAEDRSASVLVLEAGVNTGSFLDIPSVGLLLQQTGLDWQYETVSQKFSCFALNNNSSRWPMGKVVGGTSMLNNMIYVRGHRKDFEEWFDGKENFHYSDVEHYFKKMENRNIQDDNYKNYQNCSLKTKRNQLKHRLLGKSYHLVDVCMLNILGSKLRFGCAY